MTVISIIDSLNPGGAERVAVNIANELYWRGHRSILVATRSLGQLSSEIVPGVDLHFLKKRAILDPCAAYRLSQLFREEEVDIVHAHSSSVFIAALASLLAPSTIVYHDHSGVRRLDDPLSWWVLRPLALLIGGAFTVNMRLYHWMKHRVFGDTTVVSYLQNFVCNTGAVRPVESTRQPVRIVCMANFRWEKDHGTLIRAIAGLKSCNVMDFRVFLLGRYDPDDPYYITVTEQIQSFALSERVVVMQSITDVHAFLQTCHIGVLSSVTEGLPVALLEYAVNGLAVVTTDVGECAEVVDHGSAGILVPTGDHEALSAALSRLLTSPEQRHAYAEAIRGHVAASFSSESVMPELIRRYRGILTASMTSGVVGMT